MYTKHHFTVRNESTLNYITGLTEQKAFVHISIKGTFFKNNICI